MLKMGILGYYYYLCIPHSKIVNIDMNHKMLQPDLLFEVSWEVCNKVGGIYTVLSTKAKTLKALYKDHIIFIGPDIYNKENSSVSFKESKTLLKDWKRNSELPYGIKVKVGYWDIPGKPIVILVDYKSLYQYKNDIYAKMWNSYKVDSLHAYGDYDESCMFGVGAAIVIENYCNYIKAESENIRTVAHFDEWTTGMGLLYLKSHTQEIATVFTTHATSIGRSICCNGKPLYDYMQGYNGDQMAEELNMQSKHSLEKSATHNADCFTTVSDVTARECVQLLERMPYVTPNGFEQNFVPSAKDYKDKRAEARKKLVRVAKALTGSKIEKDAFFIATSGRNEFRNKGIDAFIDSVKILSEDTGIKKQIVAFVLVPSWTEGPREDLIHNLNSKSPSVLNDNFITHNLHFGYTDSIFEKIKSIGMNNLATDIVKIIYVPCYLNGDDGIFDMSYYDLLIGFDCTVFPSYYEPWGYTPLESIAFGIPTVTTDLSGFGQWILNNYGDSIMNTGVNVVHRNDSNYWDVVSQIKASVKQQINLGAKEKLSVSKNAMKIASDAPWKKFIAYYDVAYELALNNKLKVKSLELQNN